MPSDLKNSSPDISGTMENGKVRNDYDELMTCQQKTKPLKPAIGELKGVTSAVNEEAIIKYKTRHHQNGAIANDKLAQNGSSDNGEHAQNGLTAKNFETPNDAYPCAENHEKLKMCKNSLVFNGSDVSASTQNGKMLQNSVLVSDSLTAQGLHRLFTDQICVLHVPNYIPQVVCNKLDGFLQEKGSDQYTHEIRDKDGTADLQYFGVNRYGFPLNSTYNDCTGASLDRYFSEALPTMQAIRRAAAPYLSPIDKLRVEMDELWNCNVNVATLNGRKTFCGIGRIMPASLSELSADQPHFDSVPKSYFPDIRKQFAANIYLNVPGEGGELEIWDVPPVDVDNVEDFTIPENWRSKLPESIKVKPGPGDLLLLNTRRPHAITKFAGTKPRTSIQTFIGLTKESKVFLWV